METDEFLPIDDVLQAIADNFTITLDVNRILGHSLALRIVEDRLGRGTAWAIHSGISLEFHHSGKIEPVAQASNNDVPEVFWWHFAEARDLMPRRRLATVGFGDDDTYAEIERNRCHFQHIGGLRDKGSMYGWANDVRIAKRTVDDLFPPPPEQPKRGPGRPAGTDKPGDREWLDRALRILGRCPDLATAPLARHLAAKAGNTVDTWFEERLRKKIGSARPARRNLANN